MGSREWGQWQSAAAWKGGKATSQPESGEGTGWSYYWQPWWSTSRSARWHYKEDAEIEVPPTIRKLLPEQEVAEL
ncbi:MAG: hypothetical protein ACKPKO_05640, partial [Candidatus Fonsibacter sp.]